MSSAQTKPGDVPERYVKIHEVSRDCDAGDAAKAVKNQETPLAVLIAASVAVSNNCTSAEILETAVNTASTEGWTRAVGTYLGLLRDSYTAAGRTVDSERTARRLKMLQADSTASE